MRLYRHITPHIFVGLYKISHHNTIVFCLVVTFFNDFHAAFSISLAGPQILRPVLTVLFEVQ